MSRGPYREPDKPAEGPTEQRIEADGVIAACEAKLGPLSLLVVPADLRERVILLRGEGPDAPDDVRTKLAEALEEALDLVAERQDQLRQLPDEHPRGPVLHDLWGPIGTESAAASIVQSVQLAVHAIDRHGAIDLTGPRITARFHGEGSPVVWSVHLGGEVFLEANGPVRAFSTCSHWLGTSVTNDLPTVFIRREGVADTVLKALHLRTEAQVDDAAFDAAFFIEEGDGAFVRALLTERLRDAFLARAEIGDFTFWLRDTEASLAWKTFLPGRLVRAEACAASVELLVALREALGLLRLLRAEAR